MPSNDESPHWPEDLLRSNLRQLRRGRVSTRSLISAVLRSGSREARRLLALRAVNPHAPLESLADIAVNDPDALRDRRIDAGWMTALARIHLLGDTVPEDHLVGVRLYDLVLERHSTRKISKQDSEIHLQAAAILDSPDRARDLLEIYGRTAPEAAFAVRCDLANPWTSDGDPATWLHEFNRLMPEPGIRIAEGSGAPFDRIETLPLPLIDRPEKIAVMVTCFRPDQTLLTSLRSVLGQTWRNIEVLLVDDGSGAAFDDLLDDCANLDPRVRLIRSPHNRGTYHCRNLALAETDAEFVTTHDSDDWMHPRRLEAQVGPLLDDESLMGTSSDCVFAGDRLEINRVGRRHSSLCTAALMYRRDPVLRRLGYMDSVRKAADTEYFRRMKAVFGADAFVHLPENLTLVRTRTDSLSGGDFKVGWIHPARAAYRSSYEAWHRSVREDGASPYVARGERGPFHSPRQFRNEARERESLQIVFAADLTSTSVPRISFLNDLRACVGAGLRVGVMHLPTLRFAERRRLPLLEPIQDLVNSGTIDLVMPEDQVDVEVLAVRQPSAIQFPPSRVPRARVDRMLLLAGSDPHAPFGELRYDPSICEIHAKRLFGAEPVWVCRNQSVREAFLTSGADVDRLAPALLPEVVGDHAFTPPRTGFRRGLPVIGRFDYPEGHRSWPVDPDLLRAAYPASAEIDVRIMGSAAVPVERLDLRRLPSNWTRFDFDPARVRAFLYQLDFFVYFPQEDVESIPQAEVLEAMAAGCVVLLPPRLRRAFGEGPLYCEPAEVRDIISKFESDPARFAELSVEIQRRVLERHNGAAFVECLRGSGKVPEGVSIHSDLQR